MAVVFSNDIKPDVLARREEWKKEREAEIAALALQKERLERLVENPDFIEILLDLFASLNAFSSAQMTDFSQGRASVADLIRERIARVEGGPGLIARMTERYWHGIKKINEED